MKIFHELAFDAFIAQAAGGQATQFYSDPRLQELMGAVDMLHVSGYSAQVSGTTPSLTITIQHSNDRSIWYDRSAISGITLSTSAETIIQAADVDPGANGKFAFARFALALSGTTAQGYIRLWVTGRDFSRRSSKSGAQRDQAAVSPKLAQAMGRRPNGPPGTKAR